MSRACRNPHFKNASIGNLQSLFFKILADSVSVRFKHARVEKMRSNIHISETGRIRLRRVRFQTPNSVSFSGLTEFRGASSVSSSQPIICVPKRTHRVFSQNSPSLPQNSVRLSEFSSPKQYCRNSIPPVSKKNRSDFSVIFSAIFWRFSGDFLAQNLRFCTLRLEKAVIFLRLRLSLGR